MTAAVGLAMVLSGPAAAVVTLEVDTRPPSGRAAPSGVTSFLNGQGEERRARLARALETLARALDRRRNPLYVPLDDSDIREATGELVKLTGPLLTAACALGAARWQSAEGDLAVRVVGRCAPGGRCVDIRAGQPGHEVERRLRFLAWPIGHAIVLDAGSAPAALRIADQLRSADSDSAISLILTSQELHSLRQTQALRELVRQAARVRQAVRDTRSPLIEVLDNISRAASVKDELPWLRLPAGAILVVPRLASLATPRGFVEEVRGRLRTAGGKVEWLAEPPMDPGASL